MAVRLSRFTSFTPDTVEMLDGTIYPCRQISAAGMDLRERIASGSAADADQSALLEECVQTVADLLGAPLPEVRRLNLTQLGFVLNVAATPAEMMQQALAEDEEKNAVGGAVPPPTPRRKRSR